MLRIFVVVVAAGVLAFQSPVTAQQPVAPVPADAHAHAEHGPHGGELLEIGEEEFHAELVIDEAKNQFVIFLLDGQAKAFVAIDAQYLAINLKMAGKPVQMKLKPAPQEVDQKGFSSRFGIVSPELLDALHDGHADAKMALKIGAKAYTVKIAHSHDHAGHNHGPETK